MTNDHIKAILHGQRALTDSDIDDVLAEARAVIKAAPSPAALGGLYDFVTAELAKIVEHRGLGAIGERAAMKQAIGI